MNPPEPSPPVAGQDETPCPTCGSDPGGAASERRIRRRRQKQAYWEAVIFTAQLPIVIWVFPPDWQIPYLQFVSIYAVVRTALGEARLQRH